MATATTAPIDGAAAFSVLSSAQLFRDIVSWLTGWPAPVALRWREIKAARHVAELSPHDFMWELIWRRDRRVLELTKQIPQDQSFVIESIRPAIEAGDPIAMRLAHAFSTRANELQRCLYWKAAFDTFPGHVSVLEELDTLEPLNETYSQTLIRPSNRSVDGRSTRFVWGASQPNVDTVKSVVLAEWLLTKFGPDCFPRYRIGTAVLRGNLALVRFLNESAQKEICPRTLRSACLLAQHDQHDRANRIAIVHYLLRQCIDVDARELEVMCFDAGDHETLELIRQTRGLQSLEDMDIDRAASQGHVKVIKLVAAHNTRVMCTSDAMDAAATNGHLDVVEHLHDTSPVGCTSAALDGAAANGHLKVVQFLHANRHEGCTTRAMDAAAAHGFLDVVQFLHDNRREGCTTDAMDHAAQHGHLSVVAFLHENRHEGCTPAAFTYPPLTAKRAGQDERVAKMRATFMYLLEHRTEMHPESVEHDALRLRDLEVLRMIQQTRGLQFVRDVDIDILAGEGDLALIRFLVEHVSVVCTTTAMDAAAACNQLDVVKYLHETRTEGCTTMAMDMAANATHWETVAFLAEHRTEGCTVVLLIAAVRLGRLDLVQRYYTRVPSLDRCAAVAVAGVYGHAAIHDCLLNPFSSK